MVEVEFKLETTRPVRVIKRDRDRELYLERHERSLLHLLIEKDIDRAKIIIEKILLTKKQLRV